MNLAILSLIFFLLTVVIGISCRVNCGLVAMISCFILVQFFIPDMVLSDIYRHGWPVNIFFMMMSVFFLFGMAGANGTMEIIAKRILRLMGGNTKAIPICIFVMTFVLSASGAGPGIAPMIMAIAMGICKETKISCFMMGVIIECAAGAGGLSPIATNGIIAKGFADAMGVENYISIWIAYIFVMSIEAVLVYFFRSGHRAEKMTLQMLKEEIPAMNREQKQTAMIIGMVIFAVIVLKIDISMAAMAGAAILLILGVMEDKKAASTVNWNTLLLVAGMYMLITIVDHCGGMKLIADQIAMWITPGNSTGIMVLISGLLATVTSASGVVMPTLLPICEDIAQNLGGAVSIEALAAGVVIGANCAFFSPFSVLGSMTLALYPDYADKKMLFKRHLQMMGFSILMTTSLGFLGVLSF